MPFSGPKWPICPKMRIFPEKPVMHFSYTSYLIRGTFILHQTILMSRFSINVQNPHFGAIFDHFGAFMPKGDFSEEIGLCHTHLHVGP